MKEGFPEFGHKSSFYMRKPPLLAFHMYSYCQTFCNCVVKHFVFVFPNILYLCCQTFCICAVKHCWVRTQKPFLHQRALSFDRYFVKETMTQMTERLTPEKLHFCRRQIKDWKPKYWKVSLWWEIMILWLHTWCWLHGAFNSVHISFTLFVQRILNHGMDWWSLCIHRCVDFSMVGFVQCTYKVSDHHPIYHRTMYIYNVQCTMYNVQCTMYNVQYTMYNVHIR